MGVERSKRKLQSVSVMVPGMFWYSCGRKRNVQSSFINIDPFFPLSFYPFRLPKLV
ncbi:unnamed protein product [Brassica rapa]|uniref:Uncharacterized protein n=2 Tax=Brassica TaxID=3705 RepID=A0A8D9G9A6_BRACM|nr:unnamed protein product [Brassica napus]CAG7872821.1 unnamed protein product [Brassica rapa]